MDTPGTSESLMKAPIPGLLGEASRIATKGPLGVLDSAVNIAGYVKTNRQLTQVQKTLGSILQVSQIAAAASVVNLGVSIVGFTYMAYKMNQLKNSLTAIQERMESGFDRIDAKIGAIARQVGYLVLLAEANSEEQQKIRTSISDLHRMVLITEIAELQSWLNQLSRFPNEGLKEAIRVASKVRHTLSDQAVRVTPEFEPRVMLVADIAVRGWVVATATEAQLLMNLGQHHNAHQLIESEHPKFAALADSWARCLLSDKRPQLRTAYRFAASRFQSYILPERIERIARIHEPDRLADEEKQFWKEKEASLELEMSYNASLGKEWTQQQIAIAEYLDGLSELSDRLESLGAFARECEIRKFSSSRDVLPGPNTKPGIYVLSASEEN